MAQAAVNTFLPIYLRNELGYAPYEAAGYLFLGQVAGIASSPLLGFTLGSHRSQVDAGALSGATWSIHSRREPGCPWFSAGNSRDLHGCLHVPADGRLPGQRDGHRR